MVESQKRKASAILRIHPRGHKGVGELDYPRIEETIAKMVGVLSAKISPFNFTIKVEYDPEKLDLELIRKRLQSFLGDRIVGSEK